MTRPPVRPAGLSFTAATFTGLGVLGLMVATLAPSPRAHGDITNSTWTNNTLFHYRVTHMPDLDQRREALPCDGAIHCVPTCATNMVMYAANHGFPDVDPGPGFWEGDSNYLTATNAIGFMGLFMQTSCTPPSSGGTGGGNANAGLSSWLIGEPGLIVNDHLSVGNFSPTHGSIGKSLCGGRIGSVSFGRYNVVGDFKGIPLVQRNGGHCTTAVKVRRNGGTRELWVRDPASDDGDLDSQSEFFNDIWSVTDITVIVMPDIEMKTMTAINYTPGQSPIRLIDGHRTITPAQGYSWVSSLGAVALLGPMNFANPTLPPVSPFPSPTGTAVLQMAWQDLSGEMLAVCANTAGQPTLHAIDPVGGASHPIPTPAAPVLMTTGRGNNVYICPGNELRMVLYPQTGAGPTTPVLPLPHAAHAMAYDDARDDLVLVSRTDRKLMRAPRSLMGPVPAQDIPTFVPLGVRLQISFNPLENGVVYLWSDASNSIWRLSAGAGGLAATALSLPAAPQPRAVDFDDRGRMFVSNTGTLIEFEPVPTGGPGAWQVASSSLFAGLPAGIGFRLTRSRTNFTPGVHDTEAWTTNIDPAELPANQQIPDCFADTNDDQAVDVDDLIKVILAWGPCASPINCPGDTDNSHAVDVDDLINVILGWGPCPGVVN